MTTPGQQRKDVTSWPTDREARAALEVYLDSSPRPDDRRAVWPLLAGDRLNFVGADLSSLDLSEAYLFNAVLTDVRMANCVLRKATLSGADLQGADLTGADLSKAEVDECQARGAIFRAANLFAVNLRRSDLSHADLRDAVLNSARLQGCNLGSADLRGASLRFCRFGNDSSPTLLYGARMFGCAVDDARGVVSGPVDVGESSPELVDGPDLVDWLRRNGATDIGYRAGSI